MALLPSRRVSGSCLTACSLVPRSNYYSTCLRVVQQLIALGGCSSSPPRECEHCIVVDPWSARLSPGALSPRVVEALKGLDEQAQCFLKVQ